MFFCLIILAFSLTKTMAANFLVYIQLYFTCYMQADSPMTAPSPLTSRVRFLSAASRTSPGQWKWRWSLRRRYSPRHRRRYITSRSSIPHPRHYRAPFPSSTPTALTPGPNEVPRAPRSWTRCLVELHVYCRMENAFHHQHNCNSHHPPPTHQTDAAFLSFSAAPA